LKKRFLGYVVWWGRGCGFRVLGNFGSLQLWELEMQNLLFGKHLWRASLMEAFEDSF
jgi:hypothetical protein